MSLGTEQLALRLEAWAAGLLNINTYEHPPNVLSEALPLVVCEIQTDRRVTSENQFEGYGKYQQTYVRPRQAELLLMVHPEPSWDASKVLYGYVDTLAAALLRDVTLGGRVPVASKFYDASYTPPEIQHADGTVARIATFRVMIGETSEV